MKKCLLILLSIIFALSLSAAAHAQDDVLKYWESVKAVLGTKDYEKLRAGLKQMEGRCADLGITSFEELSASMVKQGRRRLDQKDMSGAMALFDSAARISPNYPPPYYARGWACLTQKTKFLMALDSFIEGFDRSMGDFWWSFYFAGNKATSLLFTLAALFSLYGLFMAIRYSPLLAHDISEKLKRHESENPVKFLVLPGTYFIVLLALGYWWAVAVVSLSLWVYFNKKEKALAITFFILLVFMPEIMTYFGNFAQAGGNRLLWVMDEVNKGRIHAGAREYLQDLVAREPDNENAVMTLAQLAKKERRYQDAEALYDRLVAIRPASAVYLNNLANIHFLTNDYEGAIAGYKSAVQKEPGRILPYFNISQVYGETLRFTEREDFDRRARDLNPVAVAELRENAGDTPVRMVFDEQAPVDTYRAIAFDNASEGGIPAGSLWDASVKVLPLQGARVAGVGFIVLAFAVGSFRKRGVFAHFCQKCGKVSCRKCQRPYYNKDLCAQCHQIFVKLEGVEARDRVRKILEAREEKRSIGLKYRVASLLIPGSGHFLTGRPIGGFVFTGAFVFLIKDIFFGSFYVVPYDFELPFLRPGIAAMSVLLAVFYLIAQLDTHRITK